MSDTLGQYLSEIGYEDLLDVATERRLSQEIESGILAQKKLDDLIEKHSKQIEQAKQAQNKNIQKAQKVRPNFPRPKRSNGKTDTISKSIVKKSLEEIEPELIHKLDATIKKSKKAKDQFIRANLRLVVSVARRYPLPNGMELGDLIQEGNLGLEHAVTKFDWRKGFKFSTYATFWIRQAIGRALDQKTSLVKLPGDKSSSLRAALRASSGDASELEDEQAYLHRLTTPASLDRPIGDADGDELSAMVSDTSYSPEKRQMEKARKDFVSGLLKSLDSRSQEAIRLRFGLLDGERYSFKDVGQKLDITAEAARRLIKRSMVSLKDELGHEMPEYMLQEAS